MKEDSRKNVLKKIDALNEEQLLAMIRQLKQEKKRRSASRSKKPQAK